MVEHFVHTEGVTGSNPVPPTTSFESEEALSKSVESPLNFGRLSKGLSIGFRTLLPMGSRADNLDGSCREVLKGKHAGK